MIPGYSAFVHERYKHNTAAFDVTNRYIGQPIDEETGLYFYQSRYYDAQLGRFTQADTIVPSADTSQALNRYAYVKNNPLKFTDPSGHGWFSSIWKSIKGFIGTIVTVALTPFLGPLAAVVGSAIGTLFYSHALYLKSAITAEKGWLLHKSVTTYNIFDPADWGFYDRDSSWMKSNYDSSFGIVKFSIKKYYK